jgi:hypothetical protein
MAVVDRSTKGGMSFATATWVDPWLRPLLERFAPPFVVDAHTHLGEDADGTACAVLGAPGVSRRQ